jgi:hypothetical protein
MVRQSRWYSGNDREGLLGVCIVASSSADFSTTRSFCSTRGQQTPTINRYSRFIDDVRPILDIRFHPRRFQRNQMELCDIRRIIKSLNVARRVLMALLSRNYFYVDRLRAVARRCRNGTSINHTGIQDMKLVQVLYERSTLKVDLQ